MQGKEFKLFSFVFFVVGIFLLLSSHLTVTGALIGAVIGIPSQFNLIAGLLFIFTALLVYVEGKLF